MSRKEFVVYQPTRIRERIMNAVARLFAPHMEKIYQRRLEYLTDALVESVELLERSRDVHRMDTHKQQVFDDRLLNARRRKGAFKITEEITKFLDRLMRDTSRENHEATH